MGRFTIRIGEDEMPNALECVAEPLEEQQGHIEMPIVDSACPKCSWKKARRDPSACFFECCLCGERTSYEKRSGGYFVHDKTGWQKMEATDSVGTPICKGNESTATAGTSLVYINHQSVASAADALKRAPEQPETKPRDCYVYDKITWHTNRLTPPDDECVDTYICEVIDITNTTGAVGR